MKILKTLVLLLYAALALSLPAVAAVGENADPGAIAGTVGFSGFSVTSVSMTAVGGGQTFQKTTYDSGSYQMPVAGGGWSYSLSASCGLAGGNNKALTVSFSQRNFPVAPGATVANDYLFTPGIVRFQVNISGEATTSAAAAGSWATKAMTTGEKTATYSSGTPSTADRSFSWDLPVVPNQQVELTAIVDVGGPSGVKRYTFSKTAASSYLLSPRDVAPGEVVIVPLEINYAASETPPAQADNKGVLAGKVDLLGLPANQFVRHSFNGANLYANPAQHSREYTFNANQYTTPLLAPPTTYFNASVDTALRWPYINGNANNNKAAVYPGTTSYLDLERAGGFLAGTINLSGTIANEDLYSIVFNFTGLGNVYDPSAKKWAYLENYYGSAPLTRHATSSLYKKPSVRDYQVFLTAGDWELFDVNLTRRLQSPLRTSSVSFIDHQLRFNGQTYFGSPIHIEAGTNVRDFNYCFGSAVVRFRDPQGRLLRSPTVSGTGIRQTNGVVDLTVNSISANNTAPDYVETAEVELIGPPADYKLTTIRVTADDGMTLTFPARNLSLSCNTTKVFDFPGPTLTILAPQAGAITNAQTLPVSGRVVSGAATIASVTVNGEAATLIPVSANEVMFTYDLALTAGENAITIVATEVSGAQATEEVIVQADHWLPMVSIVTPVDGTRVLSGVTSIPLRVEAADLGYGYTLSVYQGDILLHTTTAPGDTTQPVGLVFDDLVRGLDLGEHVITATVADQAGNRVSVTSTIALEDPPLVLNNLTNQIIEATSAAGAAAKFEVTASAPCNSTPSPALFQAPVPVPQGNATTTGGVSARTFQWSAVTAPDGHPAQYQVQISDVLDFATVLHSSVWLTATSWTQSLPAGTWYWRVIARDSIHTEVLSSPATGNSFSLQSADNSITSRFSVLHHTDCSLSGGVYPAPGDAMWVGPLVIGEYEDVEVDRSFLTFDTTALAGGAVVLSARLNLDYQYRDSMDYGSVTNVHESTWVFPGDETTFYNVGPVLGSQLIAANRPQGLTTFTIRPDYIQKTDLTGFALVAANDLSGEIMSAAPGYSKATSFLEITYIPSTAPWAAPILIPQENTVSSNPVADTTFRWNVATAADGDPVHYLVEISSNVNFAVINFSSPWLEESVWTQPLPPGLWYWRVTARDAVHSNVVSNQASSSFIITYQPPLPPGGGTVICSANSGDTFPLGATEVLCTASDACGRSASGSFTIIVRDSIPPVLTLPEDQAAEAVTFAGAPVTFTVTAMDAIDPAPVVNCSPSSDTIFPIGTTTVDCLAMDASGNFSTGSFNVTVTDTAPPVLTVPADITAEASGPLTAVAIGQATATQDAAISNNAPAAYPVGLTTVTWTATAVNGKSPSGPQNVTVTDTTPPVFSGLTNLTVEATGSLTPLASGSGLENVSDAVGVASLSYDAPAAYPLGTTVVHWTATDVAGNVATTVQTVTVRDTTAPVLTTPTNITVLLNTSLEASQVQAFLAGASATDAVDALVTTSVTPPAGLNSIGAKPVTFTAVDDSGNQTTGTATINVIYGGGEEFMEPVRLLKPFRQGATVPVKIALSDASGANVTTATVRISVYKVDNDMPVGDPLEVETVGSADSGSLFKLTDGHYQFNLSTKKLTVGTYQIRATLDDGTYRAVPLSLK